MNVTISNLQPIQMARLILASREHPQVKLIVGIGVQINGERDPESSKRIMLRGEKEDLVRFIPGLLTFHNGSMGSENTIPDPVPWRP